MTGARTSKVKVDVAIWAGEEESVAVIVKVVLPRGLAGVPVIIPVAEFNDIPVGSAGDTEY